MTQQQTVQEIYQAFGRGDAPAILERLAEDVEWEHDAPDHGVPWLTPGRGKQHALAFLGVVGSQLNITKFDVKGLFESGNQVVGVVDLELTVRTTGKSLSDLELHLWTFGPNGKVSRFRHILDTHTHWLASRI